MDCWHHQKLGERHGTDSPSESAEGTNPSNILIPDFWPPKLIIQRIFEGFFANSAIPGSLHPFTWSGMLHSNPGDYAWGQTGLDAIVTQLLGQVENTGPPPADKEKITSLPTVTVTQEQVDMGLECPVYKEDYTGEEEVWQLPCKHFFHSSCIVPWLELHDACAVCRKSLNGEDSARQTQSSEASASNRFSDSQHMTDGLSEAKDCI
uniref:E3 ubiquitin-protein ligase RNF115 n=1 Tax=Equus caballus TaxID=9796 RepID=A0A9L0T3J1_HORSE